MKKALTLVIGLLGIGLVIWIIRNRDDGSSTPLVVVSMTQSNAPFHVFPGVGAAMFVLPDGSLWHWGGEPALQQVGTNHDWSMALAANNHTVGLKTNGTLWEWHRGWGIPAQVDPRSNWVGIAAGDLHSVALNADGTLWAWGDKFGGGVTTSSTNLLQVGTNRDWSDIGCGQGSYTLGLRRDGTLWAWGKLPWLMNGKPGGFLPTPTQVCQDTNWTKINVMSPYAVNNNQELWCVLGSMPSPVLPASATCVLAGTNWESGRLALGSSKTSACCQFRIKQDGTLWKFVSSSFGGPLSAGTQVGRRSDWVGIWGMGTVFGLTADGTVWFWGWDFGQKPDQDLRNRAIVLFSKLGISRRITRGSSYPLQDKPFALMKFEMATSQTARNPESKKEAGR